MKNSVKFVTVLWGMLAILGAVLFFQHINDERKALNECIENVSHKCGGVIGYAISLEEENARLNRLYRECRESR